MTYKPYIHVVSYVVFLCPDVKSDDGKFTYKGIND